ncbi:hypothetical protein C1Y11_28210 [Pseudomonas sp. FW305-20]|nr:hypothetical protein C1Y11_28210 [Pseudomonas sp. FW305-20]PMU13489.1 hypothetical protein C1Y10_28020 [Pseudomonas sp. FW305-122]PMU34188.1 hypothetical protein C1Y12_28100 [Pseudomonas sp. FW305-47B]PMX56502.1 hypothetical protein C1Y13_27855 [Pseudomonas sp. FW305-33]PMX62938.1 hypothetical protein C1X12_23260 [Pseudomonas sp. FW305-60]
MVISLETRKPGRLAHPSVGAGLLAKAVGQSTSMLNVKPHSRASPLPQGEQAAEPISSGMRAA